MPGKVVKFFVRTWPYVMGVVWIVFALGKGLNPAGTLHMLRTTGLDPSAANLVLLALITFEILLGVLLLARPQRFRLAWLTAGVPIVFTGFLLKLVWAGGHSCGRTGVSIGASATADNPFGIGRNVVLLLWTGLFLRHEARARIACLARVR